MKVVAWVLKNKQLETLPNCLLELYGEFEQSVINDIARRLVKESRWTETAELQAKMLQDIGYSPSEIRNQVLRKVRADKDYQKYVAENTLGYKKEVQEKITETLKQAEKLGIVTADEAANMSYNNDLALWNEAGKDLVRTNFNPITAEYSKALNSELKNITKSTAFKGVAGYMNIGNAFNRQLDLALMKTVSGTFSYQQAVDDVVKSMADNGLKVVYKSQNGRITLRNIDSAVRTAVLTASNRITGAVSMQNLKSSGEDLVEVSSHSGARSDGSHGASDHAYWQGKVYSISHKPHYEESKRLGYSIKNLEDTTGYPNDPSGLMGFNCRHTFYTFFEGISEPSPIAKEPKPVTINGKTYTQYEATQKQRQMERNIRATKREISAKEACGKDITEESVKLNTQIRQYKVFSNSAGLWIENNRLGIYGYTRRTASNTRSAYAKATKIFAKSDKSSTIVKRVETVEEAKVALVDDIGFVMVDKSFDKIDASLIISNTNQLLKLERKFGAIKRSINPWISSTSHNAKTIAFVGSGRTNPLAQRLSLCPEYYSDRKLLLLKGKKAIQNGWSMPAAVTDAEVSIYTVTHEYGHMLHNVLIAERMKSLGWDPADAFRFVDFTKKTRNAQIKWYNDVIGTELKKYFNEIQQIAKRNNPSFKLTSDVISEYGRTSYEECFAEIFANSQLSKPNELGKAMNIWFEEKGLIR